MSINGIGTGYMTEEFYAYGASKAEIQKPFEIQEEAAVNNTDKLLGIGFLSESDNGTKYGMKAEYADDYTAAHPIVKVTVQTGYGAEEYRININEINPRSATELEMFALLSYTDAQGISDGGNYGSYQRMKVYAENAEMNGYWEGNHSYDDFMNQKYDWQKIVINMWEDYSDAGIYTQMLNCMSLNDVMEKFSIRFVDFDNITFIDKSSEASLRYETPDVSEEVVKAWFEAAEEIEDNGMLNHISQKMWQRLIKWQQNDESDMFGGSITSALKAAKEALQALEYPLTSEISHLTEVREEIEMEKALYESFIRKLEALQKDKGVTDTETDMADTEETETKYQKIIQDYIQNLFTKLENGDTETSYQIGGSSFTLKEWEKLLEKFDSAEDEIKKLVKEEIEKRIKEKQEEIHSDRKRKTEERISDVQMQMLISETLQIRVPVQDSDEIGTHMEDTYLIAIDRDGIRCSKPGQDKYEWELLFTDETQYWRAKEFFNYAGNQMDNFPFAALENFWKDYLNRY